jgi:hypothetical protein
MLVQAQPSQAALGLGLAALSGVESSSTQSFSTGLAAYSVRQSLLSGGTSVSEYVTANNRVFAVAWEGPFLPDLKQMLGTYFQAAVTEAQRAPKAGRARLGVEQPDVVIESQGRMRAFHGRAWLPQLLPAGFDTDGLK